MTPTTRRCSGGGPRLTPATRDLVNVIRRHRLNYDSFRKAAHLARRHLHLRPPRRGRQLPKLLPEATLKSYFETVTHAGNLQHELLLKLLFYTAVRVSELVAIKISDVNLNASKIFIESGKGDRDRYILFPEGFRLALRAYIAVHTEHEYLFESNRHKPYSTRRVQQIVGEYAAAAGITERVHPHLFRHQMLTWLTAQGLSDAQIQLISGHKSKRSLEVYQHLALGDVAADYQDAAGKVKL